MSLWTKFLCYVIDWHDWRYFDNGICTNADPRERGEIIASHQQCTRCGLLIDHRCQECKEHGTGTCFERLRREEEYWRRKRNCCIHCPSTPH